MKNSGDKIFDLDGSANFDGKIGVVVDIDQPGSSKIVREAFQKRFRLLTHFAMKGEVSKIMVEEDKRQPVESNTKHRPEI